MKKFVVIAVVTAAAAAGSLMGTGAMAGTSYKFTVACTNEKFVKQWDVGSVDPGKEYLRVQTGVASPNCSINDFNPETDGALEVRRVSHEGAVIEAIPLAGPLIKSIGDAIGGLFK